MKTSRHRHRPKRPPRQRFSRNRNHRRSRHRTRWSRTANLRSPIPSTTPPRRPRKASAVIVAEDFPAIKTGMLRSQNPYLAWAKAIELFYQPPSYAPGVHPTAVVHPKATVGKNAHLGPYVVIDEKRRHRRRRRPAGPRSHLSRSNHRPQFLSRTPTP